MAQWRASPLAFVTQALRVESIDPWQEEALRAIEEGTVRLALKASKGPGKTALLAWLGWWCLSTRIDPKVVATSITGDNLADNLWAEFAKWQSRSDLLKREFTWSKQRIFHNKRPETWWASARTWSQSADSSQQANTLAGVHADTVMILVDESGGIPDAVVSAADAALANMGEGREGWFVQAGNPTHTEGPLWRACTVERDLWRVIEINGDPDNPKRSSRVSVEWAKAQIARWGRDNPWVAVNVFGRFPARGINSLLGPDDVSAAQKREYHPKDLEGAPKVIGLDVARYGDDRSVLTRRQGPVAFTPKVWRGKSTMELAGILVAEINEWGPDAVFIDATGVGAGVVDRCRELKYRVTGVESGGGADDDGRFLNRRAEMWWRMADWVLRSKGQLYAGEEGASLAKEVVAPAYTFKSDGRMALEAKVEIKKRLGLSPDLADSLALTFAFQVAPKVAVPRAGATFAQKEWLPYGMGRKR
jgi:hypothetical protein